MDEEMRKAARRIPEEVFNGRHPARAAELVTEDFVGHNEPPGFPGGRDGLVAAAAMMTGAFSDLHYDILDEIVEGDLVVHRARGTGTNDGELMGIPASGKRAEWDEIHISRMAPDGRIAEHWGLVDTPAIMMAIGAMPAPPAAG